MSAIIKQLTDKEYANDLLPITNTKAVYDDAGNRLDNTITTINSNVSNALSVANSKVSASLVSDAYNPSKTYAQGEFCIYNNTLWKSKVANNLGNTPTEGSYWTATNVGNELKTIKSITANFTTDGYGMVYFASYNATKMIPLMFLNNDYGLGWLVFQISALSDSGIGFRITNPLGEPINNTTLNLTILYIVND